MHIKLKKEIHKIEISKKKAVGHVNSKNSGISENTEKRSEIAVKKYKDNILSNIKKLNSEQKKGILTIIENNLIDKNIENNIIEFDINKIPINQLKMLDKYINKCLSINNNINNNNIISNIIEKKCENNQNKLNEEKKDYNIFKDDDVSSFLSSDDDYEDDDDLD